MIAGVGLVSFVLAVATLASGAQAADLGAVAAPPAPSLPKVVLMVTVEGPPDLIPGVVKGELQKALSRYGYQVLSCLDDAREEAAVIRAWEDAGIKTEENDPKRVELLKKMEKAGCPVPNPSTLLTARVSIQSDQNAHERAIFFSLRNLDDPVQSPRRGDAKKPISVSYGELVRVVVDGTLRPLSPISADPPTPPPPPPPPPAPRANTALLIALGTGTVGLLVGVTTGLMLLVQKSRLDTGDCSNGTCGMPEFGRVDTYNSLRLVCTGALIVAGLGAGTGAVLFHLGNRGGPELKAAIVPGPAGGSAALVGRF